MLTSAQEVVRDQQRRATASAQRFGVLAASMAVLALGSAVVGGAAIGGNINRESSGQQVVTQDVQRCTSAPDQANPDYWDVTYNFRGQEHRMQMTTPPGATVTVNEHGEPRA